MAANNNPSLKKETLMLLPDAADNFGGIAVPLNTLYKYIYRGVRGVKLETVRINARYTSKEAIQRFIERIQKQKKQVKQKQSKRLTNQEMNVLLKKYKIIKDTCEEPAPCQAENFR